MFKIFYKYNSVYYLNIKIYDSFLNSNTNINVKNLKLYFSAKINLSKKFKLKLYSVTEKLDYIVFFTDDKNDKDLLDVFFSKKNEYLPPWIVFPDYIKAHISWDQGIQYDYSFNNWMPYWKSLSQEEKLQYHKKYNTSDEWKEWLELIDMNL